MLHVVHPPRPGRRRLNRQPTGQPRPQDQPRPNRHATPARPAHPSRPRLLGIASPRSDTRPPPPPDRLHHARHLNQRNSLRTELGKLGRADSPGRSATHPRPGLPRHPDHPQQPRRLQLGRTPGRVAIALAKPCSPTHNASSAPAIPRHAPPPLCQFCGPPRSTRAAAPNHRPTSPQPSGSGTVSDAQGPKMRAGALTGLGTPWRIALPTGEGWHADRLDRPIAGATGTPRWR